MKQSSDSLKDLIRYEEQVKSKIRQTDNLVLDHRNDKQYVEQLNGLIQEEQILIKYLELESSKLQLDVRKIYTKNINRFKKKISQHKDYVFSLFGASASNFANNHKNKINEILRADKQSIELLGQKHQMYEAYGLQNNIGMDIKNQGEILEKGFQHHRQIREQANEAESSISQIQRSILKRKFMFYSLFFFFTLAIVFIVYRKITK